MAAPAHAAFPGSGVPNVWSINSNGTGRTQLTDSAADGAFTPRWSPDGSRILFTELVPTTAGDESIMGVMNADGSNQTSLRHIGSELDPAWSHDGERIAFVEAPHCPGNPDCPPPDIYTMRL